MSCACNHAKSYGLLCFCRTLKLGHNSSMLPKTLVAYSPFLLELIDVSCSNHPMVENDCLIKKIKCFEQLEASYVYNFIRYCFSFCIWYCNVSTSNVSLMLTLNHITWKWIKQSNNTGNRFNSLSQSQNTIFSPLSIVNGVSIFTLISSTFCAVPSSIT